MKLTLSQIRMLKAASESQDGSVLARGYGLGDHAVVTGRALATRDLLTFFRNAGGGGEIYRINDAGRAALAEIDIPVCFICNASLLTSRYRSFEKTFDNRWICNHCIAGSGYGD